MPVFRIAAAHIDIAVYEELASVMMNQGVPDEVIVERLATLADAAIPWDVVLPNAAGQLLEAKDDWLVAILIRPLVRRVRDPEWRSRVADEVRGRWAGWRARQSRRRFDLVELDDGLGVCKRRTGEIRTVPDPDLLISVHGDLRRLWRQCGGVEDEDDDGEE